MKSLPNKYNQKIKNRKTEISKQMKLAIVPYIGEDREEKLKEGFELLCEILYKEWK